MIYACTSCGCQETTLADIKRHFKENPGHATSESYGKDWRLAKVHIYMGRR